MSFMSVMMTKPPAVGAQDRHLDRTAGRCKHGKARRLMKPALVRSRTYVHIHIHRRPQNGPGLDFADFTSSPHRMHLFDEIKKKKKKIAPGLNFPSAHLGRLQRDGTGLASGARAVSGQWGKHASPAFP